MKSSELKKVNVKQLKTNKMKTKTTNENLVNNSNQTQKRKFNIGDKIYLKNGIGKGSIGHVYKYEDWGHIIFYKCFFNDYKVTLKRDLSNPVPLQGGYEDELLILLEKNDKSIEDMINEGLEFNRKNFNISIDYDDPTQNKLFMSYE